MMNTYSPDHREQCEVRAIIRERIRFGIEWARAHLAGIEKKRGLAAAERLRKQIADQWAKGNRGTDGDWR